MKKILYIIGVALAVASCTKSEEVVSRELVEDECVNLFAAAPTRVTADGMEWENGDDIGVSIYTKIIDPDQDLNYKYTYVFNLHYTISDATTGAMSPVSDDDKCTLGNQTRYYAHSPYSTDSSFFVDGDYKCDVRINQTPILSAFTDSAEGFGARI